jgi:arylsulfatase A-like enzyme
MNLSPEYARCSEGDATEIRLLRHLRIPLAMAFAFLASAGLSTAAGEPKRPNVILIITDDQGYGEIAAHGNPVIKTPNLDALHADSLRLTDFHVDPTCSPTRSAVMTGRYSTRTGVWHTINGRSMLRPDEWTLAEMFKANGYATGMIGKWHLGDNYPCRPQDQGFEHVVWHHGGGLGNAPDHWGNDYFDDTYVVGDQPRQFEGYCTDVWFREAARFIDQKREKPFFLYLAPNAPHSPHIVPEPYAAPYKAAGMPDTMAKFYGMITNIDENLGKLRAHLASLGLADNTLLIFMTDNGTTAGWIDQAEPYPYFNAGMRGWKGSAWDGGHRVPCFWHWPAGDLEGGRDIGRVSAHIDLLPTLADLLGLKNEDSLPLDGISLVPLLKGGDPAAPERTLFVHVQRAFLPPKWKDSAVMTQRWRLIDGKSLYDITADPGQSRDMASEKPEVVTNLRARYEEWWSSLDAEMKQIVRYEVGAGENPMLLSSHDWLMPGETPAAWHQKHIQRGDLIQGPWAINVKQSGNYEIVFYRWPPEMKKAMEAKEAKLRIAGKEQSQPLQMDANQAVFRVHLDAGPAMLETWLTRQDGQQHGAYFTAVRLLPDS